MHFDQRSSFKERETDRQNRIMRTTTFIRGRGGVIRVPRQFPLVLLVKGWRRMKTLVSDYAAAL
jgi:hypothetical protein